MHFCKKFLGKMKIKKKESRPKVLNEPTCQKSDNTLDWSKIGSTGIHAKHNVWDRYCNFTGFGNCKRKLWNGTYFVQKHPMIRKNQKKISKKKSFVPRSLAFFEQKKWIMWSERARTCKGKLMILCDPSQCRHLLNQICKFCFRLEWQHRFGSHWHREQREVAWRWRRL